MLRRAETRPPRVLRRPPDQHRDEILGRRSSVCSRQINSEAEQAARPGACLTSASILGMAIRRAPQWSGPRRRGHPLSLTVTDRSTATEGHGSADRRYSSIRDNVDGSIGGGAGRRRRSAHLRGQWETETANRYEQLDQFESIGGDSLRAKRPSPITARASPVSDRGHGCGQEARRLARTLVRYRVH